MYFHLTKRTLLTPQYTSPWAHLLTLVSRQCQTWEYFQSLRMEDPFFPLIIPRRKNVKPHFTKRIGRLAKVTQQASKMGPDIQFYNFAPSCSQHSFIQQLSTSTLQGAGDTDEKTTCLKGAYLPVWVCALKKKRKQSKQVTNGKYLFLGLETLMTGPYWLFRPFLCPSPKCLLYVQHESAVHYMCSIYWRTGNPYFPASLYILSVDNLLNIFEKGPHLSAHCYPP